MGEKIELIIASACRLSGRRDTQSFALLLEIADLMLIGLETLDLEKVMRRRLGRSDFTTLADENSLGNLYKPI